MSVDVLYLNRVKVQLSVTWIDADDFNLSESNCKNFWYKIPVSRDLGTFIAMNTASILYQMKKFPAYYKLDQNLQDLYILENCTITIQDAEVKDYGIEICSNDVIIIEFIPNVYKV